MSMEESIQEQITKHLPSQVGEALQRRLEKADALEAQLEAALEDASRCRNTIKEQRSVIDQQVVEKAEVKKLKEHLAAQEVVLNNREMDLRVREAVIEVREKEAAARVVDNMEVVKAVFCNNRFKYERSASNPVVVPGVPGCPGPADQYGNCHSQVLPTDSRVEQGYSSESVEGES